MKKRLQTFKRIASLLICTLAIGLSQGVYAADENPIQLYLDGSLIEFDVYPQIINGRTMVPIRTIFEAMGATVDWDAASSTAICYKDDTTVQMTINQNVIYINDEPITMDTTPVIVSGRTLAPARYVAESFGATVDWDAENRCVIISSAASLIHPDYYEEVPVWYIGESKQTMYAPDGRTIEIYESEVEAYKNVGWYETYEQAQAANLPQVTTPNTNNDSHGVYSTPYGKKYHFDPNCGGKNSSPTTLERAISLGLTPCSKCTY